MFDFLDFWRQEAQIARSQEAQVLYRHVTEGDDISDREKYHSPHPSSPQYFVRKIYQVAPFLLLLNILVAAIWSAYGVFHVVRRPKTFSPDRKIDTIVHRHSVKI